MKNILATIVISFCLMVGTVNASLYMTPSGATIETNLAAFYEWNTETDGNAINVSSFTLNFGYPYVSEGYVYDYELPLNVMESVAGIAGVAGLGARWDNYEIQPSEDFLHSVSNMVPINGFGMTVSFSYYMTELNVNNFLLPEVLVDFTDELMGRWNHVIISMEFDKDDETVTLSSYFNGVQVGEVQVDNLVVHTTVNDAIEGVITSNLLNVASFTGKIDNLRLYISKVDDLLIPEIFAADCPDCELSEDMINALTGSSEEIIPETEVLQRTSLQEEETTPTPESDLATQVADAKKAAGCFISTLK